MREPFTSSSGTLHRWTNKDFPYSIPSFDSTWSVQPELSALPQSDVRVARQQVSFSANADLTRFELTVWDKNPRQTLRQWYNKFGKELCGTVGVTEKNLTTPAGTRAIWVSVEGTIQAPETELFFAATKQYAYCIRYLNRDDSANLDAFAKLCFGLSLSPKGLPKGISDEPIGPSVRVRGARVGQCGPVVDSCNCAGNNPYPCCSNGSNCTWGAWDRMCCNWGYAAGNWGNAATWASYARSAGRWVQSMPTVGAVGCRLSHTDAPYGHVAYVLSINGEYVYCIEMNCNLGPAGWSYRTVHRSWFDGGYITYGNPAPPAAITITSATDTCSWGSGRIDIIARGSNNNVYHRSYNGSWSAWKNIGGVCNGSPTICTMGAGRLDVFMRGMDNCLWHNASDGKGTWWGWENLGDFLTESPDAVSRGWGKLDVVFRGNNNNVWHRWMTGWSWAGYRNLGMYSQNRPTICAMPSGRLDVFFRGGDNALWHNAGPGNNTWWGWEKLGDYLTDAADCVSRGEGRIDVVFRGSNNNVWHRWMEGYSWVGWKNLGMAANSYPSICTPGNNRLDAFFTGFNANVWHNAGPGNNTWWGWEDLGHP